MSSHRGFFGGLAAALAAAVVAVGHWGLDIGRSAAHEFHPRPFPVHVNPADFVVLVHEQARQLAEMVRDSSEEQAVMCSAISFVQNDAGASWEDFSGWAADEVNQTPPMRSRRIFDDVTALYGTGDLDSLWNLYCDVQ